MSERSFIRQDEKLRPTNWMIAAVAGLEARGIRGVAIEMPGKVYLVGAGPGDPELLTRKAWRVLQSADVVLHDDLVSEEILRVLPRTAQVVNVGKRCGAKGISQDEINERMVSAARTGKIVARLKNGDPLLFGRAGEEMEALRQAGIEFEVIPGATAPSLLIVGSVAGPLAGEEAREEELSGEFRSEILSLAMQHPVHDSYGRGDFE